MEQKNIRVAVVGVGRLGRIHAKLYKQMEGVTLAALCDPRPEVKEVADEFAVPLLTDFREIQEVDAVSVVTPTIHHREVAEYFLARSVPCLIEKPLAGNVADCEAIVNAAQQGGAAVQVGHVERYNPSVRAVEPLIGKPVYCECVRISPFPFRSLDIGVVMDLMIHDIDIVLNLMKEPVAEIRASGARIFSPSEDTANVRIQFKSGAVALFTASRIAIKQERKLRMYSTEGYASCDLLEKQANVFRKREALKNGSINVMDLRPEDLGTNAIEYVLTNLVEMLPMVIDPDTNPLLNELADFIEVVRTGKPPLVSAKDGLQAVQVAQDILECMVVGG